jgi:diacylglycerol kinase family enzyme
MTDPRTASKAHAVILNPLANAGNGARRWKALLETEAARTAGLAGAALFDGSQPGGLAALPAWISERLRAGDRCFVAAGGDGTMNLALNTLLGAPEHDASVRFGAVGLGSSNDFQKPYSSEGRVEAAGLHCRLDFERAALVDVGRMDAPEVRRHFLINASVGVTAEANWNFNEATGTLAWLKRSWVDGAIIATALRTFQGYRNFRATLSLDGGPARDLILTNLGVVKNIHFSGQMRYDIPQALDDGAFGVHLCEGMNRMEMIGVLSALNAGKFSGRPKTSSHQARRVEIVGLDGAFAVETDGEVIRADRATFTVLKQELCVCP